MEFIDHTGHIFTIDSTFSKPIGYEDRVGDYIFWLESPYSEKLSIDNYYIKPIRLLLRKSEWMDRGTIYDTSLIPGERYLEYEIEEEVYDETTGTYEKKIVEKPNTGFYHNTEPWYSDESFSINISVNSQIFKLISAVDVNNAIENENGYINITDFIKTTLTENDVKYVNNLKAFSEYNYDWKNEPDYDPRDDSYDWPEKYLYDFICIPFYVIGNCPQEGTWTSNILININNEQYCPITVGGTFYAESEELVINGQNMGIQLPKDIIKAVYQSSFYNYSADEQLYNEKLKELLLNFMDIKGQIGNYNSVLNSLKWFGWSDKLSVVKLIETDNEYMHQYIRDFFNIKTDLLASFKRFRNSTFISLVLKENEIKNDNWLQNFDDSDDTAFWGEGKPLFENLFEREEVVKYDEVDLEFIKSYYDFTFNEIGLKLCALRYYYEKYFLPIHLKLHSVSIEHRVFTNDNKLIVNYDSPSYSYPITLTYDEDINVKFNNGNSNNVFYLINSDIIFDNNFNVFENTLNDSNIFISDYYNSNLLTSFIPISINHKKQICVEFYNGKWYHYSDEGLSINSTIEDDYTAEPTYIKMCEEYNGYVYNKFYTEDNRYLGYGYIDIDDDEYVYNCILVVHRNGIKLQETHFSFTQNNNKYKGFVISPNTITTENYFDSHWLETPLNISLNINGKWFNYDFLLKISHPQIETGKLVYKYGLEYKTYSLRLNGENNIEIDEYIGDISAFKQFYELDLNKQNVKFASYMHEPDLVTISDIDFYNRLSRIHKINDNNNIIDNLSDLLINNINIEELLNNLDISLNFKKDIMYKYNNYNIKNVINDIYRENINVINNKNYLNKHYFFDIFKKVNGNWEKIKYKNFNEDSNDSSDYDPLYQDFQLFKDLYTKETVVQTKYEDDIYKTITANIYNSNIILNDHFLYDMYIMKDIDSDYYYTVFISQDTIGSKIDYRCKKDYIDNNIFFTTKNGTEYMFKYFNEDEKFNINRMYIEKSNGINHFSKNDIIVCYLTNIDNLYFKYDYDSKWWVSPYSFAIKNKNDIYTNSNIGLIGTNEKSNYLSGYYSVICRYIIDNKHQHQSLKTAKILIQ